MSFTVSSRTIPNWLLTAFVLRPDWMKNIKGWFVEDCWSVLLWRTLIFPRYVSPLRTLTFTHDPQDFKFIHHITDVGDLHEVKRRAAWGAWSSCPAYRAARGGRMSAPEWRVPSVSRCIRRMPSSVVTCGETKSTCVNTHIKHLALKVQPDWFIYKHEAEALAGFVELFFSGTKPALQRSISSS